MKMNTITFSLCLASTFLTIFSSAAQADNWTPSRIFPNLPVNGTLIRAKDTAPVYMIFGYQKLHISSAAVFDSCNLSWANVHVVDKSITDAFETGIAITETSECSRMYTVATNQGDSAFGNWCADIDFYVNRAALASSQGNSNIHGDSLKNLQNSRYHCFAP